MNARTRLRLSRADFLAREETQPREDVLVDPEFQRAENVRRTDDGPWTFRDMSQADALQATSIGCTVALADVFDGVDTPPGAT